MGFASIESFLENHIEGFFNKKFDSDLEFPEIEKKLQREIERCRSKVRRGGIPNIYDVYMSESDYRRMPIARITEELRVYIARQVILLGTVMDGTLMVRLHADANLSRGVCRTENAKEYGDGMDSDDNVADATIVRLPGKFSDGAVLGMNEGGISDTVVLKNDKLSSRHAPVKHDIAVLRVIDGPDKGAVLDLGEMQASIGRREQNDLILTDPRASRLHSCIAYERHRHVLYDAGSLNGTYLNGEKIDGAAVLSPDDEIGIGGTLLVYEVES